MASAVQYTNFSAGTVATFRTNILAALSQADAYVIVNFYRVFHSYQRQYGGGHYSPLGAYDKDSDSVLMLDVSRYFGVSSWIDMETLYYWTAWPIDSENSMPGGLAFVWLSDNTFNRTYVDPTDNGIVFAACSQGSTGSSCSSSSQCLSGFCDSDTSKCSVCSTQEGSQQVGCVQNEKSEQQLRWV